MGKVLWGLLPQRARFWIVLIVLVLAAVGANEVFKPEGGVPASQTASTGANPQGEQKVEAEGLLPGSDETVTATITRVTGRWIETKTQDGTVEQFLPGPGMNTVRVGSTYRFTVTGTGAFGSRRMAEDPQEVIPFSG